MTRVMKANELHDYVRIKHGEKKFAHEVKFDDDNDFADKSENKYFYFKFDDKSLLDEQERVFKNFADAQASFGFFKKNFLHIDFWSINMIMLVSSKMSRRHLE